MGRRRRRRGEGSVYRSQGSWIACFPLGSINGRRLTKRTRSKTERQALIELERLRRTYGSGGEPATGSLGSYLGGWLRSHGRSVRPSTLTSYTGHVALHIAPLLGGIPLARLRPADVRRLVDDLEHKRLAAGTIIRIVTTLRIALNEAVADRTLADNPASRVKLPRDEREPVRAVTADEADAILDAVRGHWCEHIIRVLLGSGMRLGEAIGLDQGDVLAGFVRVRISKTYVRAVPITVDAQEALREATVIAHRNGPHEPVFFGPRGDDRLRGDSVTHALPRLTDAAGLGRITPHGLRHAAATLMLTAGVPMRAIADQLGHKNPAITARVYAHVTADLARAAVDALERRKAT